MRPKRLVVLLIIAPLTVVVLSGTPANGQRGQRMKPAAPAQLDQLMGMAGAAGMIGISPEMLAALQDPLAKQDFELESKVPQAVQTYADAEENDGRAKARQALRGILEQQFTLRQERRMREIVELEAQIKRLRETLRKRANAKEQIIDRQLNHLLGEADGLEWGSVGVSSPVTFPGLFGGGVLPGGLGGVAGGALPVGVPVKVEGQ
jgi:hypothetical protein